MYIGVEFLQLVPLVIRVWQRPFASAGAFAASTRIIRPRSVRCARESFTDIASITSTRTWLLWRADYSVAPRFATIRLPSDVIGSP